MFAQLCALSLFSIWGIYMYIIKADMDFTEPRNDSAEDRLHKLEGT